MGFLQENIVLTKHGDVKVIDFGCSCYENETGMRDRDLSLLPFIINTHFLTTAYLCGLCFCLQHLITFRLAITVPLRSSSATTMARRSTCGALAVSLPSCTPAGPSLLERMRRNRWPSSWRYRLTGAALHNGIIQDPIGAPLVIKCSSCISC